MVNNYFKEQYESSEQIRRGIHTILNSDSYTDEYKLKIRTYLNGIDVDKFSKEDSLSISSESSGEPSLTKIKFTWLQIPFAAALALS